MHKLTFYPLGNADCCKIDLSNGQKLLFDYAHCREGEHEDDLRIDLAKELREDLDDANRDYYDVVAFTHGDEDHIRGSSDFFYLEHAKKYQDDDRIKINELWVPAAMILEEGLSDEARVLRSEARYRLIKGKGIRVFSRPEKLKNWLEENGLTLEKRKNFITDAGKTVPDFDKSSHGVEFFVHSPFAAHVNDEIEDRNESALILHATFEVDGVETKFMIIGDTTHEILTEIMDITRAKNRNDRLNWDIYSIPHHCSYRALSDEKGDEKTKPVKNVKWLLDQGNEKGILVSCSDPIPEDDENDLPPHRQAANYYQEVADKIGGEFKVTMEHPKESNPEPLKIEIDSFGATCKKMILSGGYVATSRPAPRAGLRCGN